MTNKTINKMWGGRFEKGPSETMEEINASIGFDKRLYKQDIRASQVHAQMLGRQDIISSDDAQAITKGLDQVRAEIDAGDFEFKTALEDIHMNVEARLTELIGPAAGRLHTSRSRNDQAVTDVKLWLRDEVDTLDAQLVHLIEALIDKAEENSDTAMPGFTHLQVAQPVSFGHHLLAYVEMMGRDLSRLRDCRARLNECPLGAAALAGSPYPIDRHWTAEQLEFDRPTENSMDSVSARDHIAEFLFFASMNAVHLSRLAEELVNWNSDGFKFVNLSDAFTSGSSIMPQKKNPDAAELLRAKPGRIIGSLNALLIVMKGLPLSFMKDMQEDKEPMFEAADSISLCIRVATGLIKDMEPYKDNMKSFLDKGFATATDLADWLVIELDIPFRQAHHITGEIVAIGAKSDRTLSQISLEELQAVEHKINTSIYDAISNETSLAARKCFGGTAPENVREACGRARKRFLSDQGE
ncbi:argininosuccinate lyase [Roseovarius sp. 2305UL8-3]|uniref:argininosuccinate lyase n=1 Tax=Roseovarius conchicola TaxID=3121636 RepID=UPI0035271470